MPARLCARVLQTAGGRVLAVSTTGADLKAAERPMRAAEIEFEGCHYRRDIGRTATARRRCANADDRLQGGELGEYAETN